MPELLHHDELLCFGWNPHVVTLARSAELTHAVRCCFSETNPPQNLPTAMFSLAHTRNHVTDAQFAQDQQLVCGSRSAYLTTLYTPM